MTNSNFVAGMTGKSPIPHRVNYHRRQIAILPQDRHQVEYNGFQPSPHSNLVGFAGNNPLNLRMIRHLAIDNQNSCPIHKLEQFFVPRFRLDQISATG